MVIPTFASTTTSRKKPNCVHHPGRDVVSIGNTYYDLKKHTIIHLQKYAQIQNPAEKRRHWNGARNTVATTIHADQVLSIRKNPSDNFARRIPNPQRLTEQHGARISANRGRKRTGTTHPMKSRDVIDTEEFFSASKSRTFRKPHWARTPLGVSSAFQV